MAGDLFGYLKSYQIFHYIGSPITIDFRNDLTFVNKSNIHLKREFMQTSKTFSIHFWLNTTKKKNGIAPVYARVTVNGKRAEISLKRYQSVTSWDPKTKRARPRTPNAPALNAYLDQVYAELLVCQKQLLSEFKLITSGAIKARYLGEDQQEKTLLELVDYHLTPVIRKSGSIVNGRSRISKIGNQKLRNLLFMCSFNACKYNKACRGIYERLVAKGKSKKLALIAVCNKLLKQAFAIAKSGLVYDQTYRSVLAVN